MAAVKNLQELKKISEKEKWSYLEVAMCPYFAGMQE
jgi:hypothetical protein